MNDFLEKVKKEADRAVKKHGAFNSFHEGFSVLSEEVHELMQQVYKKEHKRNYKNVEEELVQIAAVCVKLQDFIKNRVK